MHLKVEIVANFPALQVFFGTIPLVGVIGCADRLTAIEARLVALETRSGIYVNSCLLDRV